MAFKIPQNTDKHHWTLHSFEKMKFYGLSPQRVIRVIRNPQRIEEGIAEDTIAVMQPPSIKIKNGKKTWSQEIWVMYQIRKKKETGKPVRLENLKLENILGNNKQLRIISAWRYPGVSPKNNPIPEEILREALDAMA